MDISRNLAFQIVTNLKDVVNQDLNFMDREGIIVASTDPNRINTFHEAARECVNRRTILVIEYDEQYKGSKKGVNVPVEFNSEIIGVIGITGEYNIVEKYVSIIKKMTEILLKEEWIKENEIRKRDNNRNILESVLFGELDESNVISSENSASKYLAVSKPLKSYNNQDDIDKILSILDSHFYNDNDVIYTFLFQELSIIFINKDERFISSSIKMINNSYFDFCGNNIYFGISNLFYDFNDTRKFYKQAISALNWSEQNTNLVEPYLFYDDLDLGLLLSNLSIDTKHKYVEKVLSGLDKEDIEFYNLLIDLYGKENGSIKNISEKLFMHKNTIQYRLNKLHSLTGFNPREPEGFMILKLAFLVYDYGEE